MSDQDDMVEEEISGQQKAEAIAEFLGKEGYENTWYDNFGIFRQDDLTGWLASDAGTVAMIEKLGKNHHLEMSEWKGLGGPHWWLRVKGLTFVSEANPTLNAALQSACLEVLNK